MFAMKKKITSDMLSLKSQGSRAKREVLISQAYQNSKYQGKHIIIIGGKIYATKTGVAEAKLLDKLVNQYPKETPTILYVPKADTLILIL